MRETYDQIIEEIEHSCIGAYGKDHGIICDSATHYTRTVMKHLAARIREAVGGDPAEWWVLDADGNRVHILDDVKNCYNHVFHVFGLGVRNGKQTVEYDDGCDDANTVRKVIPETRERIIEKALAKLGLRRGGMLGDVVEEAVDSAMKLGAEQ